MLKETNLQTIASDKNTALTNIRKPDVCATTDRKCNKTTIKKHESSRNDKENTASTVKKRRSPRKLSSVNHPKSKNEDISKSLSCVELYIKETVLWETGGELPYESLKKGQVQKLPTGALSLTNHNIKTSQVLSSVVGSPYKVLKKTQAPDQSKLSSTRKRKSVPDCKLTSNTYYQDAQTGVPWISLTPTQDCQSTPLDPYNFPEGSDDLSSQRCKGKSPNSRRKQKLTFGRPRFKQLAPLKNIKRLKRDSAPIVEEQEENASPACDIKQKRGLVQKIENNSSVKKPCSASKVSSANTLLTNEKTPPFQKPRRVSFGPDLSPEQFLTNLPPNTPVHKGGTPSKVGCKAGKVNHKIPPVSSDNTRLAPGKDKSSTGISDTQYVSKCTSSSLDPDSKKMKPKSLLCQVLNTTFQNRCEDASSGRIFEIQDIQKHDTTVNKSFTEEGEMRARPFSSNEDSHGDSNTQMTIREVNISPLLVANSSSEGSSSLYWKNIGASPDLRNSNRSSALILDVDQISFIENEDSDQTKVNDRKPKAFLNAVTKQCRRSARLSKLSSTPEQAEAHLPKDPTMGTVTKMSKQNSNPVPVEAYSGNKRVLESKCNERSAAQEVEEHNEWRRSCLEASKECINLDVTRRSPKPSFGEENPATRKSSRNAKRRWPEDVIVGSTAKQEQKTTKARKKRSVTEEVGISANPKPSIVMTHAIEFEGVPIPDASMKAGCKSFVKNTCKTPEVRPISDKEVKSFHVSNATPCSTLESDESTVSRTFATQRSTDQCNGIKSIKCGTRKKETAKKTTHDQLLRPAESNQHCQSGHNTRRSVKMRKQSKHVTASSDIEGTTGRCCTKGTALPLKDDKKSELPRHQTQLEHLSTDEKISRQSGTSNAATVAYKETVLAYEDIETKEERLPPVSNSFRRRRWKKRLQKDFVAQPGTLNCFTILQTEEERPLKRVTRSCQGKTTQIKRQFKTGEMKISTNTAADKQKKLCTSTKIKRKTNITTGKLKQRRNTRSCYSRSRR